MPGYCRAAAVIGAVAFALAGAAQAQNLAPLPLEQPPEGSTLNGVTVSVPKLVERTRMGVEISEVFMSVRVPYGDLDMATPAGVAELDRRVREAGDYVCEQLDRMYPVGTPDEFQCARRAVAGAQPQVVKARASR